MPKLESNLPLYSWQDTQQTPSSVVIAVHGLTMHGGVFDTMAKSLASQGAVVYAPDLRGYGRWMSDAKYQKSGKDPNQLDYAQSYEDLLSLVKAARAQHPGLPLFLVGESLGADMALHVASSVPDQIDGLVLSSPAIKHSYFVLPLVAHTGEFLINPHRKISLIPFIKKLASEDPQIVAGAVEDPLVRKHLTAFELFQTCNAVKSSLDYAKKIPANMPILVIQGGADRMVHSNAVVLLLEQLKSTDQTVRWFSNRGHLLLETAYMKSDTMETVDGWLADHTKKLTTVAHNKTTTEPALATNGASSAIIQASLTGNEVPTE
ncbi:MAG TPA: alpha/beta fold hydrolase [Planktothrix sp.]